MIRDCGDLLEALAELVGSTSVVAEYGTNDPAAALSRIQKMIAEHRANREGVK